MLFIVKLHILERLRENVALILTERYTGRSCALVSTPGHKALCSGLKARAILHESLAKAPGQVGLALCSTLMGQGRGGDNRGWSADWSQQAAGLAAPVHVISCVPS